MKRIKSISIVFASLIIGATTFISCGGDDPDPIVWSTSPSEVVLEWQKGASTSFGITFSEGDGEWSITQAPEFVNVYPMSGKGAGTVRVTTLENNTRQPLEGAITIEVNGADVKLQTVRVVQQKLEDCYVEPANILQMSDGLAYNWDFGRNTKYYYWDIFTQTDYNKMSESEVLKKVVTGNVDDRQLPDNDDYACNYNLKANTQYVVVTVSFAEGDVQGDVVITPLTTKSTNNQPEATINDMQYYNDNSNNYYYGWNIKKNTYCREYYTYAAASPAMFWIYYLLDEECYPMIAWLVKNEIQKDGEDHSTSMNEGFTYMPFNNGRDQFYAAQVENGTSYFTAFPYTDKYFCVFTWGTGSTGELSGVINAVWYDFTEDSSKARGEKALKAVVPHKAAGAPKKLSINPKEIKLIRLK